MSYLVTNNKNECFGCEACVQICSRSAIQMSEDTEGFRYPEIDLDLCTHCNKCRDICPADALQEGFKDNKIAWGGCHRNDEIREESTSGGAFTAFVDTWCDSNYVIFGAKATGLDVSHDYVTDKVHANIFRKSKYSQSIIGTSYKDAKKFLKEGKKVLFSGTPCQIAGLRSYLKNVDQRSLLTIEVICEGVPTPHFMRRYDEWMQKKYGSQITTLDYRFKDGKRWDFEVMYIQLKNGTSFKVDRWFSPFWSIWLSHLMSRPSCYACPFTTTARLADISLGDLWGVHLYCPDLYNENSGASLIVCNTEIGKNALELAKSQLKGHELKFTDALQYQSPLRKTISMHPDRGEFMEDVVAMDYHSLCKKWAKKPTLRLLISKYVWGTNRQKVFLWNLKNKTNSEEMR